MTSSGSPPTPTLKYDDGNSRSVPSTEQPERSLVIQSVNRTESTAHLEVAIEQSETAAEVEITTHPPSIEVTDSDGEVARVPLDDELTLDV